MPADSLLYRAMGRSLGVTLGQAPSDLTTLSPRELVLTCEFLRHDLRALKAGELFPDRPDLAGRVENEVERIVGEIERRIELARTSQEERG